MRTMVPSPDYKSPQYYDSQQEWQQDNTPNPFAPPSNPFAPPSNPFAPPSNPFIPTSNPFIPTSNPFIPRRF